MQQNATAAAPDPAGGAYSASPDPYVVLRGRFAAGGEGRERRGREGGEEMGRLTLMRNWNKAADWLRPTLTKFLTDVCTVRHLGTLPIISLHALCSFLVAIYVPPTDTSSSYLAVDSTHTAVGLFPSLLRRSGSWNSLSDELKRSGV